jgi:hypothetical protein
MLEFHRIGTISKLDRMVEIGAAALTGRDWRPIGVRLRKRAGLPVRKTNRRLAAS